jgi:hypothetical protein
MDCADAFDMACSMSQFQVAMSFGAPWMAKSAMNQGYF